MLPVTKSCGKQEVVVVPDVIDRRPATLASKCFPHPRLGCAHRFSDTCEVTTHPGTHSGKKPFVCSYEDCGRTFAHSYNLRRHLRIHTGEKPFVCSYEDCRRSFAQSACLVYHLRAHAGDKRFVCRWEGCGYASIGAGDLTRHIRIHTGEKSFFCQHKGCGRAFAHSYELTRHMRVHTGEKPFVCPYEGCRHSSSQSGDLTRHLRIHTGEKPFVCPSEGCDYASIRATDLKRHMRTHAKAKPSPIAQLASPGVGANPAPERDRQGRCVSSDSPAVITTVLATGHQLPAAQGLSPARPEPLSPWFGLPASPSSQAAELLGLVPERAAPGSALSQDSQPGCAPAVSTPEELVPGGSRWHADDSLAWLLPPLHTTREASDQHLLAYDDKVFWQKLISPESGDIW